MPTQTCVQLLCTAIVLVFFDRIDGVSHVPVGAATSPFANVNTYVSYEELWNGTLNDCSVSGNCSINLQWSGTPNFTTVGDPDQTWSAVMIHPQNFPTNWTYSDLENYFAPTFRTAASYRVLNYTGLIGPVGSRPNVKGIKTSVFLP